MMKIIKRNDPHYKEILDAARNRKVLGRGVRDLQKPPTSSPQWVESSPGMPIAASKSPRERFLTSKDSTTKGSSKFKNVRKIIDGHSFDSTKEANRYRELKLMEHAGLISNLEIQKPFVFIHNEIKLGKYVSDFVFVQDGKTVVEDVKGYRNPKAPMYQIFKMKVRMMKAFFGLDVTEI